MKRFLIQISYDGTNFNGWQVQATGRTVQQTIENAISEIAKENIKIVGSGRTDAGVHAKGQFAHFDLKVNITTEQLKKALNTKLPKDILITDSFIVDKDFNARYNAELRTYEYIITREYDPFYRFYKSYIPKINYKTPIIQSCLPHFIGKHDFTSFAKHNPEINNYVCEIVNFKLTENSIDLIFEISANRFLHNMVRRIVGTLLNISHFNYTHEKISEILKKKDPKQNIIYTAPPQGLYLKNVRYDQGKILSDC